MQTREKEKRKLQTCFHNFIGRFNSSSKLRAQHQIVSRHPAFSCYFSVLSRLQGLARYPKD